MEIKDVTIIEVIIFKDVRSPMKHTFIIKFRVKGYLKTFKTFLQTNVQSNEIERVENIIGLDLSPYALDLNLLHEEVIREMRFKMHDKHRLWVDIINKGLIYNYANLTPVGEL